jgi:SpoVK/Ycf46/Vps4 family AAA+-type ATPase
MNSLVGESQSRLRQAMNIIHAVSRGKVLFLATCNSTLGLNPALMRRFKSGKFYFDLPNSKNLKAIWKHYLKGVNLGTVPSDSGWSPANIKVCVETARSMAISLTDAAQYIVPEGQASARSIEQLRSQAEGVWISATESGPYHRPTNTPTEQTRQIDVSSFDAGDAHKVN